LYKWSQEFCSDCTNYWLKNLLTSSCRYLSNFNFPQISILWDVRSLLTLIHFSVNSTENRNNWKICSSTIIIIIIIIIIIMDYLHYHHIHRNREVDWFRNWLEHHLNHNSSRRFWMSLPDYISLLFFISFRKFCFTYHVILSVILSKIVSLKLVNLTHCTTVKLVLLCNKLIVFLN
jgi:hypothetical protein